jgi:hypothetical protein
MPFPFLPGGALLAASVLIGALAVFGLILRAMDRAIVGLRDNLLSGLVAGIRTWGTPESDRFVDRSSEASSGSPQSTTDGLPPGSGWVTRTSANLPPSSAEVIDLGSRPIGPVPKPLR